MAAPFVYICKKNLKPRAKLFIPAAVWFIVIFILLVMPGDDIPSSHFFDVIYFDKWVHAGIFGLEVILVCWPFFKTKYASLALFIKITVAVIAYGVAMEYVQKLTPDRDFDVWDMVADAFGAVMACILVNNFYKRFKKKQQALLMGS